jgi:hypothetical protein
LRKPCCRYSSAIVSVTNAAGVGLCSSVAIAGMLPSIGSATDSGVYAVDVCSSLDGGTNSMTSSPSPSSGVEGTIGAAASGISACHSAVACSARFSIDAALGSGSGIAS